MKHLASLFANILTSASDTSQRDVRLTSSNSSADGIEKATVIEIASDQWNVFRGVFRTCQTSKMELFVKIVIR